MPNLPSNDEITRFDGSKLTLTFGVFDFHLFFSTY
jgi:hypothetical protein